MNILVLYLNTAYEGAPTLTTFLRLQNAVSFRKLFYIVFLLNYFQFSFNDMIQKQTLKTYCNTGKIVMTFFKLSSHTLLLIILTLPH